MGLGGTDRAGASIATERKEPPLPRQRSVPEKPTARTDAAMLRGDSQEVPKLESYLVRKGNKAVEDFDCTLCTHLSLDRYYIRCMRAS